MFKNILIIGFGMIGSSIARSIPKSRKQAHIYAFDKSKDFSKRIKKAKLNVSSIKSLDDIKKLSIDLIIVCTPVLQYENILKKLQNKTSKFLYITATSFFFNKSSKNKLIVKQVNLLPTILYCYIFNFYYFKKMMERKKFKILFKRKNEFKKINFNNFKFKINHLNILFKKN